MSAAHTPGPWATRKEFGTLCVVDETGEYIADINDRETFDENLEIEDEEASNTEAEANARLIAAAPELLDALDEAYGELSADSTRDGPRCLLLTKIEAALVDARGAA